MTKETTQPFVEKRDVTPHTVQALFTLLSKRTYSRDLSYLHMRIIIILSIAVMVLTITTIALALRERQYVYFATNLEGQIQRLTPLNESILSETDLLNWTATAVTGALSYGFADYRERFLGNKKNFTSEGWKGFEKGLIDSGNLETIKAKRITVRAALQGAPVVTKSGVPNGRKTWEIQMPIVVSYHTANGVENRNRNVTVIVARQSETINPKGLGIVQLVVE